MTRLFQYAQSRIVHIWNEDQGQDLTEYTLLLAFVILTSGALFLMNMSSVTQIWGAANTLANQAAQRAAGR